MVKYIAPTVMVDNTPSFFGPDATREKHILGLEAAWNHHTGTGQGTEFERKVGVSGRNVCEELTSHEGMSVEMNSHVM